uniref:Serine-threonine/tyrosine-protein kinase catalytic domain-containing protein n=1 Tax=Fagus sylvatica TaxID=28930 RepID=A0A2N9I8V5_FAGSY
MEKARQVFKAKDEYFIRNGAILLEKQISCNQGRDIEPIKVFSAKDIQQASNNYDPNLILGSEIVTVYKGILDDRQVAIKVKGPLNLWSIEKTIDFSLNEVTIKQLISHKNVVRLYGCCLETEIPILVFEFCPKGTVFSRLHGQGIEVTCPISWLDRVRIATETSYALWFHALWQVKANSRNPSVMLRRRTNLVDDFAFSMEKNCILQIVDDVVQSQGSNEDIQAFADLAMRCIKKKGYEEANHERSNARA